MSDKNWFSNSFRRNLVDMHIEDWDEQFLSKFDPKAYVELLKTANVQSAMIYANSHLGYCYWPVKTGHMHRGLGGRDILGELIDLCHNEGLDVIVYYSLLHNNWAYEMNPSWRLTNIEGKTTRENSKRPGRYGICCLNSTGYREFINEQVKELHDRYTFEGIFYDMTFWGDICYCESCRERFSKEVGGELPTVEDWQDTKWISFQEKREFWLTEFAAYATGVSKKYKPDVSVEHNAANFTAPWTVGTTLSLAEHNDYIGGDLYGGFFQESFICKLYSGMTRNKPFEYMTSRCDPNLGDHTTMKSPDALKLHTYISLAHAGAFLFIDAINPSGTLNPELYKIMGRIFEQSSKYEEYLGGKILADVAVYFSFDTKVVSSEKGRRIRMPQTNNPHLDASVEAARLLKEYHIPYNVICRYNINELDNYQVLILSDPVSLSNEEIKSITRFVADGGSVYASRCAVSEILSVLFGLDYIGETMEDVTYMAPTNKGQHLFPDGTNYEFPLCIFSTQMLVKQISNTDACTLASVTLPYTDPDNKDIMSSIHSDPHGKYTQYPSIVRKKFGKGNVIWTAAPIELYDRYPHKIAFTNMIKSIAGKPFHFKTEAPAAIEVMAFHQPDKNRYIMNLINIQERFPLIPAYNIKVRLNVGDKKPASVYLIPEGQKLDFRVSDNYIQIALEKLDIFCMVAIEYQV